jgi:hypothetical protein
MFPVVGSAVAFLIAVPCSVSLPGSPSFTGVADVDVPALDWTQSSTLTGSALDVTPSNEMPKLVSLSLWFVGATICNIVLAVAADNAISPSAVTTALIPAIIVVFLLIELLASVL